MVYWLERIREIWLFFFLFYLKMIIFIILFLVEMDSFIRLFRRCDCNDFLNKLFLF